MPTLYLMLGYPGAGKTTVAKMIATLTGAHHLWADKVRHDMFGKPDYSHSQNMQAYNAMNSETERLLNEGKSVVFDTAFNHRSDRDHLRNIAEKAKAKTILIWVKTPEDVARERATQDAELQNTRYLGNMSESTFEMLVGKLEEPVEGEDYISIIGQNVTEEKIKNALGL